MARLLTLMTSQWADMDMETMCKTAKEMGYDGLELACQGKHLDVNRAAKDPTYVQEIKDVLAKYGLECRALAAHIIGQCVGDYNDPRLNNFAPAELADKPDEIRAWGIETMKNTAIAADLQDLPSGNICILSLRQQKKWLRKVSRKFMISGVRFWMYSKKMM